MVSVKSKYRVKCEGLLFPNDSSWPERNTATRNQIYRAIQYTADVWKGQLEGRNMYAGWIQKQGNWPYGIPDKEYQALAGEFNPN